MLSFVNTRLRDGYSSLCDFCEDFDVEEGEIRSRLAALGYEYDEGQNAFKRR